MFFGGINVKICDFGQKMPSEFGEDLFFLEIACFWAEKKPSDFGEDLFFFLEIT